MSTVFHIMDGADLVGVFCTVDTEAAAVERWHLTSPEKGLTVTAQPGRERQRTVWFFLEWPI